MNSDFVEILQLLEKWKVQYVVIGGYAVMEHSEPRATKDLDILISCNKKNASRIFQALTEFGGALVGIDESFFSDRGKFYKIGRSPNRIDIITSAEGAPFKTIWKRRLVKMVRGVTVNFIGIDELIALKMKAGRPQDLIDVDKLKLFKKLKPSTRKR